MVAATALSPRLVHSSEVVEVAPLTFDAVVRHSRIELLCLVAEVAAGSAGTSSVLAGQAVVLRQLLAPTPTVRRAGAVVRSSPAARVVLARRAEWPVQMADPALAVQVA